MLNKLFKVRKLTPFTRSDHPKPPSTPTVSEDQNDESLALRIVHPGGRVECYYMAIPANIILEKYPSFVLAKPEVFRRPWDSVVRPEKILRPGQKFYLVPPHTVKKLRRRIRKPKKDQLSDIAHDSFCQQNEGSDSSFSSAFKKKKNGVMKHVRFAGIDVKGKACQSTSQTKKEEETSQSNASKRRAHYVVAWQPSLTSITEIHGD